VGADDNVVNGGVAACAREAPESPSGEDCGNEGDDSVDEGDD
jgi:hypothetical protein